MDFQYSVFGEVSNFIMKINPPKSVTRIKNMRKILMSETYNNRKTHDSDTEILLNCLNTKM